MFLFILLSYFLFFCIYSFIPDLLSRPSADILEEVENSDQIVVPACVVLIPVYFRKDI